MEEVRQSQRPGKERARGPCRAPEKSQNPRKKNHKKATINQIKIKVVSVRNSTLDRITLNEDTLCVKYDGRENRESAYYIFNTVY